MNQKNREQLHHASVANNIEMFKKLMEQEIRKNKEGFHLIKFMNGGYKESDENDYLTTLKKEELWVSSPLYFNDPFDCILNIDYRNEICEATYSIASKLGFSKEQIKEHIAERKEYSELEEILNKSNNEEVTKCIFVSCFSEKSNIYSLVMWGHYAKNHTGICVEYDYREMNKARLNKATILPINYTDNRKTKHIANDDIHKNREFHLNIAFTKSTEWKYEKEWRLLEINDTDRKGKEGFNIPFIKPECIYLGCKIDERLKNDVIKLCDQKKIKVYQMRMVSGSFKLDMEKIL